MAFQYWANKGEEKLEIVVLDGSYHGDTFGAMSVSERNAFTAPFQKLLFDVHVLQKPSHTNADDVLDQLEELLKHGRVAAMIAEPLMMGVAGMHTYPADLLEAMVQVCKKYDVLFIADEVLTGFGRTGKLFGFEHYGIVPDILVVGKAMGGGMPIGGFIASHEMMSVLKQNPKLGHITTFGGHPVCAAAAVAAMEVLYEEKLIEQIERKTALFYKHLVHPAIREVSGKGLMIAVHLDTDELVQKVAQRCMDKGLIIFWLLYKNSAIRITPPLTITDEQIEWGCKMLVEALNELTGL